MSICNNLRMRDKRLNILAKNIKAERVRVGLTQTELANQIDVSYNTISQIEQARQMPSVFIVYDIAKCLGVTFEDLFKNI